LDGIEDSNRHDDAKIDTKPTLIFIYCANGSFWFRP